MPSFVWNYFSKIAPGDKARCIVEQQNRQCGKIIGCQGTTKSLINHLKLHQIFPETTSKRKVDDQSQPRESDAPPEKKQMLMTDFSKRSYEGQVSHDVAFVGMNFEQVVNSDSLRKFFLNDYKKNLPRNGTGVATIVRKFYETARNDTMKEIKSHLAMGKFFSTTLDEWTSGAGRRFLNVNIHFNVKGNAKEINLGMVPITGKASGENIQSLYEERLEHFGLNPKKHIVGSSGDGASAMKKFGCNIPSEYVQCYDHGIQLGVTEVAYKKPEGVDNFLVECEDDNPEPDHDNETEVIIDDDNAEDEALEMVHEYQSTITKMRKIINFFRRSAVKNEILQNFIKPANNGRAHRLKIDSKTRWGSLYDSCEVFLKFLGPITDALNHRELNNNNFMWTNENSKRLKELVEVLHPARVAVQFLSKKSVNIIESNATINFLLNKLRQQQHQLSWDLFDAIKRKIEHRRHDTFESLTLFLNNIENLTAPSHLKFSSFAQMSKLAVELMQRLFDDDHEEHEENDDTEELQPERGSLEDKSMAQQLKDLLEKTTKTSYTLPAKNVDYKKQMAEYAKTGVRSPSLDRLLEALKTVQATSVAAERRFSEANHVVSKVRNRLGDENVNAICFLKCYFRNQESNVS